METVEFRVESGQLQYRCLKISSDYEPTHTDSDGEDIYEDVIKVHGYTEWKALLNLTARSLGIGL